MKISIITVAYNARATISDAINSVLNQTYQEIEYIVVDGGSTDGTVNIVKSYDNKIAKFVSKPDKGMYDAMNKGIALATGEVVGILNADDLYANKRVIETIVERMNDPTVDGCYGDLVYVDRNNLDKVVRYWRSCPYQDGLFERGWMPAHPTFFVKRWAYEKYGVFDLSIPIGTDHEMLFRLMHTHKIKACYIPHILVKMRMGGISNNSFGNIVQQNMVMVRTLRKSGVKVSPIFFIAKILERFKQYFCYQAPQLDNSHGSISRSKF